MYTAWLSFLSKTFIHMLWLWLALEWYTGQVALITLFKLDVHNLGWHIYVI